MDNKTGFRAIYSLYICLKCFYRAKSVSNQVSPDRGDESRYPTSLLTPSDGRVRDDSSCRPRYFFDSRGPEPMVEPSRDAGQPACSLLTTKSGVKNQYFTCKRMLYSILLGRYGSSKYIMFGIAEA